MPLLVSVLLVLVLYPIYASAPPNSIAKDGPLEMTSPEITLAQASLDAVKEVLSLVE